ncbi:hypothetical protein ABID42_003012 [Arcicella rosea]
MHENLFWVGFDLFPMLMSDFQINAITFQLVFTSMIFYLIEVKSFLFQQVINGILYFFKTKSSNNFLHHC